MLKFLLTLSARNFRSRKYTLKSFYKQTQAFEAQLNNTTLSELQLNNTTLYFRQYVTLGTTSRTKFCCLQYPLLFNRRALHTTSAKNKDDDKGHYTLPTSAKNKDDDKGHYTLHTSAKNKDDDKGHYALPTSAKNKDFNINISRPRPFKYLSLKVKLFRLRKYFDQEFDEEEFLVGAKQTVCYVAGKMADGKIEDLHGDVLTSNGVQACRDALSDCHGNTDLLKVKEEDDMDIRIVDMGFDYGEEGEKFANILLLCSLPGKEDVLIKELKNLKNLKEDFQFDTMQMVPRQIIYSFRRNYTPGGDSSDWLINYVEYT